MGLHDLTLSAISLIMTTLAMILVQLIGQSKLTSPRRLIILDISFSALDLLEKQNYDQFYELILAPKGSILAQFPCKR